MPSQDKWNTFFIKMARLTSELSKDPSTKVGAVVVSSDYRKFSIGYNGFAAGIEETPEMWENRDLKHQLVVHAELNAIINCPFDTKGCTLYCTHLPCHRCFPHLINAGIKNIFYDTLYNKLGYPELIDEYIKQFNQVKQVKVD